MIWLLHARNGHGAWTPVYGPLSDLWGGALMYGLVLGVAVGLILYGRRGLREGLLECRLVLPWTLLGLGLFVVQGVEHSYALTSREWWVSWAIVTAVGLAWAAYGLFRFGPAFVRMRRRAKRGGA
jgi:hypothetical protein